jgi:hypothetical protein
MMNFLVQFRRIRRGVSEVVRTVPVSTPDASAALARARSMAGTRFWPARTDALRVMSDGGHTLIDWIVPVEAPHPKATSLQETSRQHIPGATRATRRPESDTWPLDPTLARTPHNHVFDVGQAVTYAEDGKAGAWEGGYDIVALHGRADKDPRYAIRNAGQSYDRIVREHELRENLGARERGR